MTWRLTRSGSNKTARCLTLIVKEDYTAIHHQITAIQLLLRQLKIIDN